MCMTLEPLCCFFFFQAEDGIRDYKVTGVQTCALPISRSHPLHITSTDHAAVADAVTMLHRSGQHVCDGLDSAVRMPRKAGQIVLWNIIAEIVQQEEWIELFCVSETEGTAEMHTRTFKSRFT